MPEAWQILRRHSRFRLRTISAFLGPNRKHFRGGDLGSTSVDTIYGSRFHSESLDAPAYDHKKQLPQSGKDQSCIEPDEDCLDCTKEAWHHRGRLISNGI